VKRYGEGPSCEDVWMWLVKGCGLQRDVNGHIIMGHGCAAEQQWLCVANTYVA